MNGTQISKVARTAGLVNYGDRLAHNMGRESGTNPSLHINNKTTGEEIREYASHPTEQDTSCGVKI